MIEKEWVFDFLEDLNAILDQVRGQILAKEPIPSLWEVYAYVMREESRWLVMIGTS